MAEHQLNAGLEHYLRSSPARDLQKSVCNDPGIPPASRRDALVIMAAAGQDRAGLRFDILLLAGGEEQPLMISIPESAAIAQWQRCAREHNAELAVHSRDGALLRISGSPALPAPRRNGSPLKFRRPKFLTRRKAGIAATAKPPAEPGVVIATLS